MTLPSNPVTTWLVRLRALNRPWLWGAGLGLGLLAVVAHQYGTHPEWLSLFEPARDGPPRQDPTSSLANLSEAELAELAEIDNLNVLLNQLQPLTADTLAPLSSASEGSPGAANLLESLEQAQTSPENVPLQPTPATSQSPFAAYLERTRFQASQTFNQEIASPGSASTPSPGVGRGPEPGVRGIAATDQAIMSPLQQALTQSGTAPPRSTANPLEPSRVEGSSSDSLASEPGPSTAPSTPGLSPPPWLVEGTIPGVNQRFIRTTPEMSPPPGTTGYTVPANLPVQPTADASRLSAPALPQPAPFDLNLGATPSRPVPTPGMGVTVPGVTPSPGLPSPFEVPRSQPDISPFSVPRPPGSHTGGGYIYTFSNPNGP